MRGSLLGKGLLVFFLLSLGVHYVWAQDILRGFGPESFTDYFRQFSEIIVGDWSNSGRQFLALVPKLKLYFLVVLVGVPGLFFLHYLIIGPKRFSHQGEKILYYGPLARLIHWVAALFFTLLVVTGLTIIFAKTFGGGSLVRISRKIHLLSAFGFGAVVVPMFLMWLRDMLPAPYDLKWFLMFGGYLSRKKQPIPAGKFNAGQKMWFWLASVGGGVMLYTGFYLYLFEAPLKDLRLFVLIHNFLGLAIVALFFTHLYMSLFAVKGAIQSMLSGYKSAEEVSVLHSKYYEKLKQGRS
ncbi:formate dehydrogenase subunit gamma [Thermosulfurimonas dismutans]|nr:formate dehydrogenase subunit gamma [Thermosulfurimonas dismutans]